MKASSNLDKNTGVMFPYTWIGRIRESWLRCINTPESFIIPKKRRSESLKLCYCKMLGVIPARSDRKGRAGDYLQKITKNQDDPLAFLVARLPQEFESTMQHCGYFIHNTFNGHFRIITAGQPCK